MEDEDGGTQNGERLPALSDHDRMILHQIFNPTLPITDLDQEHSEEDNESASSSSDDETVTDGILMQRIQDLEAEGVKAVEGEGDAQSAVEFFNQAIELDDRRASSYNNRAQAKRLLFDIEGAKADLEKAIQLSRGKGKAARQAFTQRALINKLEGKEDQAREDFRKATDLGSEFSRAQLAAMNPYAAMCNAMMAEVLEKQRRGQIDQ